MHKFLTLEGILLILGYLALSFLIVWFISLFKYKNDDETRRYFYLGFFYKIACCIGFAVIYDFYYHWAGDTYYYYLASTRLGQVLFQDPSSYFRIMLDSIDYTNIQTLSPGLAYYPVLRDPSRYAVHRFLSPFAILGGDNYYTINICLSLFLFLLNWEFFQYIRKKINCDDKITFICVMLVPSVGFWSSALMKDSFTFTFNLVFIMCFAKIFFDRKIRISTILGLILSAYIVKELKVYILYAAIAGCMVWLGSGYLKRVKSVFFKFIVAPLLVVTVAFGGMYALRFLSSNVGGNYGDVDSMLSQASVTQQDLKQEYYEGHSFDIGDFDGSLGGLITMGPKAVIAGLYRPFIFESETAVMLLSGLENTALLLLTLYVFFKAGIKYTIKQILGNPFVSMCLLFSVVLALGIGISTSNFGALVRFKIPLIPFFALGWFEILASKRKEDEAAAVEEKSNEEETPINHE
ncbi:MAG: hypothetical protein J6W06_04195 [Bacteroidales bacterium]|nr:hypothetical protein [Bacteroidales bacterium]